MNEELIFKLPPKFDPKELGAKKEEQQEDVVD